MKLGSLFDGAGTCPFAAIQYGVDPVWASEIEPFPVAVTAKRFPHMKQLGDITAIKGDEIEPVDIITFGSPCQDLSIAGKGAGLEGERSGLFMEAIRIIKEMRKKTNGEYPSIAMWENVPGAFSSNKGEDFYTVLEEFCKVKDSRANVPRPAKRKGKNTGLEWRDSGLILGDGYSIAWRVLDAQFWGVPQRRKRIFLVADFGGHSAGEILFEREGLSRDFAESRNSWQGITGTTERSVDEASKTVTFSNVSNTLRANAGPPKNYSDMVGRLLYQPCIIGFDSYNQSSTGNVTKTIKTSIGGDDLPIVFSFDSLASNSMKSPNPHSGCREVTISKCLDTSSPCPSKNQGGIAILQPKCYCIQGNVIDRADTAGANGKGVREDICYTLNTVDRPAVALLFEDHSQDSRYTGPLEVCTTVSATYGMGGNSTPFVLQPIVCTTITTGSFSQINHNLAPTLMARDYKDPPAVVIGNSCKEIRRITPTECARLQGMPDWWTADVKRSDSAEYKMWGNGMALSCVMFVMEGMVEVLKSRSKQTD